MSSRCLVFIKITLFIFTLTCFPFFCYAKPRSISKLLKSHPTWLKAAKTVQKKWHVPVYVQLAIVQEESHFKADAKNRHSSAFGYAQAVNEIWDTYKKDTGKEKAKRNNFKDALQFIGWYANRMHQQLDISLKSAYQLYLSYHDGPGGYLKQQHVKHSFSKNLAYHVQSTANRYKAQLAYC